jgi:ornithine--oxo-acid transaminase
MIENAQMQGAYFLEGLKTIRSNAVREVRGRGLTLAIEFHLEVSGARRVCEELQSVPFWPRTP